MPTSGCSLLWFISSPSLCGPAGPCATSGREGSVSPGSWPGALSLLRAGPSGTRSCRTTRSSCSLLQSLGGDLVFRQALSRRGLPGEALDLDAADGGVGELDLLDPA